VAGAWDDGEGPQLQAIAAGLGQDYPALHAKLARSGLMFVTARLSHRVVRAGTGRCGADTDGPVGDRGNLLRRDTADHGCDRDRPANYPVDGSGPEPTKAAARLWLTVSWTAPPTGTA
jgi:hypothetical protein